MDVTGSTTDMLCGEHDHGVIGCKHSRMAPDGQRLLCVGSLFGCEPPLRSRRDKNTLYCLTYAVLTLLYMLHEQ